MRTLVKCFLFFVSLMTSFLSASAQDGSASDSSSSITYPPLKYYDAVAQKLHALEQKLDKKADKAVAELQKYEQKLKRKLEKIDSVAARQIFTDVESRYRQLEEKLQHPQQLTHYIPYLDTLKTSFKFLEQTPLVGISEEVREKLKNTLESINGLEDRLQKAEEIKTFLRQRREFLKQQLSKFGFAKELKKINKQVYYYSQQVNEYKEILKDPKKIEKKALELLTRTKIFQDFMRKNSLLASLFPIPPGAGMAGPASQTGFAALQTRAQVNSFIQAAIGGTGNLPQIQQNIQDAQSQVTQLRNKLNQLTGNSSGNLDMPDFKPNSQRTKSFFKRLEWGTNIQSQKANSYFPVTSDLALSLGYKLNDKSIIGIGASYKIGLGTGWNNIRISHEGVGLRSFIDWKIKDGFLISGGYEQNYRASFNRVEQLRYLNDWQQSGLLGLTKTVSLKTKLLKQTRFQLLWDFLSYQQRPKTPSILFRIGYNF